MSSTKHSSMKKQVEKLATKKKKKLKTNCNKKKAFFPFFSGGNSLVEKILLR